jgi:hypothetical protein
VIGAATLYNEGLELASLEQYAGRQSEAQQALAALDAALAKVPADKVDNQVEIARARAQYALLGQMLPPIHILRYVAPGYPPPPIESGYLSPDSKSATVLLLFPEWCAQCRKMMQPVNEFLIRNRAQKIHAYGFLALDADETTTDPFKSESFKDLLHTPTVTTPAKTLATFGAVNFPFVVITDGEGRIRFLGAVAQNAFDAGGFVEQVIDRSSRKNAPSVNH